MCNCIAELRENTKLTEGVICLVADVTYEPKFFQKLSTTTVDRKCFEVVNESAKQLSTVTTAEGTLEKGVLTIVDENVAKCSDCRTTLLIDGVRYHVTNVADDGTVTAEIIGTQTAPAVVPAGANVCVMGDAGAICGFDPNCTEFDTACHENAIQTITDCFYSCEGEQTLSEIGGMQDTINVEASKGRAMFKNHFIKLDTTLMFGWFSKELSKGKLNYTTGGYDYHVNQYGVVTDKTGETITKDTILDWACEMQERDVTANCVYMSPKTWRCFQTIWEKGCISCEVQPGSMNNTIGHTNRYLVLDGFDQPLEVITWNKIADGCVIPVDTNNVQIATYNFRQGGNYIGRLVDVVPCGGGDKRYDFKTNIGLKVLDPFRTAKLLFDITKA